MTISPLVYISVLNWNNANDTIQCIQNLKKIDYDNFKIIVVDNNSQDGSFKAIQREFPDLIFLPQNENWGYAGGHEKTVDKCIVDNADLVWIVNSDLEVDIKSLENLVNAFHENQNAIYGSLALSDRLNETPEYLPSPYDQEFSLDKIQKIKLIESDYILGCSILIPLDVIKKHGFMYTDFFLYGEEIDYSYRLRKLGIKSYFVTNSIVYHHFSSSFKLSTRMGCVKAYYHTRNTLYYLQNHHGYTKRTITRMKGGIFKILQNILKAKHDEDYYKYLGIAHFLIGKKGRQVSPEKFL